MLSVLNTLWGVGVLNCSEKIEAHLKVGFDSAQPTAKMLPEQSRRGAYTSYKSDKNLALLKKPVILRAESWLDDRRLCKQGEESPGFVGQSAR